MGRAPCCDKSNVKRGPWSPEEDATLKSYIHQNGTGGNWIALPPKIGLKRCGKSCRLRWLNYLRPNLRHGGFSEQEDNLICNLYLSIGSRWSIIAAQLPGRTDNDIKNYWNTRLKKKLLGQQKQKKEKTQHQPIISPIINWPDLSTTTITPTQQYQDQEPIISFQNPDHKYEISPTSQVVNGYINLYDQIGSTMIYPPHHVTYNVVGDQTMMVQDMFDEFLSNYPIDQQMNIMTTQTGADNWSSALNHEQVNNEHYFEKYSCSGTNQQWEEMDRLVYSSNLDNSTDQQYLSFIDQLFNDR